MKLICVLSVAAVLGGFWIYSNRLSAAQGSLSDVMLDNVEALSAKEMSGGTCFGAGPNMTNVTCYGGPVICCWAHTSVYGKN